MARNCNDKGKGKIEEILDAPNRSRWGEDMQDHVPLPLRMENLAQKESIEDSGSDSACTPAEDTFEIKAGYESDNNLVIETPNGTTYWIPQVAASENPSVGMLYDTWEHAYMAYKEYAEKDGFSTRIGTTKKINGNVTHRYILCSNAGKPKSQRYDSSLAASDGGNVRAHSFKVTGCCASLKLRAIPGCNKFFVYAFVERHNHELVSEFFADLKCSHRKLNLSDQQFIHLLNLNKIGPTVAHRLQCSLKGGHENVSGTKTEFKNFDRDIRMFIGDHDAQMFIEKLEHRSAHVEGFQFFFSVVDGVLRAAFWADKVSRENYDAFGDVVAFDATYHTNRYNMIFVPFTGVDHHKKCVTFGAGLIASESVESYKWLLDCFVNTYPKQPLLVLTDQDPSMKQAVASVFIESKHRLCMWHIMKKLPLKFSAHFLENSNFRQTLHKLVWNVFISPESFERKWKEMLIEFKQTKHPWLRDMYAIRDRWVPAFFRGYQMCCLMKTTSCCESSNAQFKVNSKAGNTLVQFLLCFDTTLDTQRYHQRILEHDSRVTMLPTCTKLPIERHALSIYTHEIGLTIQKEICKSSEQCIITNVDEEDGVKVYTVHTTDKDGNMAWGFKVRYDLENSIASCSCLGFTRIGYLCRHVFCVFRFNKVNEIPDAFVMKHWTKGVLPLKVFSYEKRIHFGSSVNFAKVNSVFEKVAKTVDYLRGNEDGMEEFETMIGSIHEALTQKFAPSMMGKNKDAVIEDLIGCSNQGDVVFKAPEGIRNKGSRPTKRMISKREKEAEKLKKKARR